MPKNDNFLQVRGHENLQIFRLSGKSFKMMKITTRWPLDTWNVNICSFGWEICKTVKCPKLTFFSQVRGHEKLQFFRLSEKAFKMMKITTSWPQDTWNVNICSFGWEICKTVKCPKMTIFRRSAVMKIFKFFDFLESLLKWWKSPPDDHWTLEMWIFAHWEICKTVKCPKLTFFRRFSFMKNFNSFDFLHRLLKWWKSPPVDHRTLEMWIFAHLGEKYAKLWNAQKWQFFAGPRSWKSSNFSTFWKVF